MVFPPDSETHDVSADGIDLLGRRFPQSDRDDLNRSPPPGQDLRDRVKGRGRASANGHVLVTEERDSRRKVACLNAAPVPVNHSLSLFFRSVRTVPLGGSRRSPVTGLDRSELHVPFEGLSLALHDLRRHSLMEDVNDIGQHGE